MSKLPLTASLVKSTICPPSQGKLDLFDTQCKGLMLEVRNSGGKTYYLRYRSIRGKTVQLRLADARDISLTQARELADKTRAGITMGNDPVAKKTAAKVTPTFETFAKESYLPFVKNYKLSWGHDESLIRNHLIPKLGKKYLDEITSNRQDNRFFQRHSLHGMNPPSKEELLWTALPSVSDVRRQRNDGTGKTTLRRSIEAD